MGCWCVWTNGHDFNLFLSLRIGYTSLHIPGWLSILISWSLLVIRNVLSGQNRSKTFASLKSNSELLWLIILAYEARRHVAWLKDRLVLCLSLLACWETNIRISDATFRRLRQSELSLRSNWLLFLNVEWWASSWRLAHVHAKSSGWVNLVLVALDYVKALLLVQIDWWLDSDLLIGAGQIWCHLAHWHPCQYFAWHVMLLWEQVGVVFDSLWCISDALVATLKTSFQVWEVRRAMIASTLLRNLDLRWWLLVFQIQLALVLRSDSSLVFWGCKNDNFVVFVAASFNWGTATSWPVRILCKLL